MIVPMLNGWQRIGILLTVIWAALGFIYGARSPGYIGVNHFQRHCLDEQAASRLPKWAVDDNHVVCEQERQQRIDEVRNDELMNGALLALLPIIFTWLLAYMLVWLFRWIRTGFSAT